MKSKDAKILEDKLLRSQAVLDGLFLTAPICIIKDRVIKSVNKALCESLGYSQEELVGKNSRMIYESDEEWARVGQKLRTNYGKTGMASTETRFVCKDGSFRNVVVTASPILQSDHPGEVVVIIHDITDLKKEEEKLRFANERFRRFVDSNMIGVAFTDTVGKILEANDYYLKVLGFTRKEFEQGLVDWNAVTPAEWHYKDENAVLELRKRGTFTAFEKEYVRRNGVRVPVLIAGTMLPEPGENVAIFVLDLTERKKAERVLSESERKARAIFDLSFEFIGLLSPEGKVLDINKTALDFAGLQLSDVVGKPFSETPWWTHSPHALAHIRKALKSAASGEVIHDEATHVAKDGTVHIIDYTLKPVLDDSGKVEFLIPEGRDVTEKKRAENEIELFQEKLRALTTKLSLVEEQERHSIATYLHDTVSQSLAIAILKLAKIRESATGDKDDISAVRKLMEESLKNMRSLTFELSPPILYELGFEAAVEWLAEIMQEQHGIEFTVKSNAPVSIVQEDRIILFRCTREILFNIIKHARATRVNIFISKAGGFLRITIEDNGIGFDVSSKVSLPEKNTGFGLFSVRVQMENLKGELILESSPGKGMKAVISYPMSGN